MKKKNSARPRTTPAIDTEAFDYLNVRLKSERGTIHNFCMLAMEDGMSPEAAVVSLMRWCVSQNSLCPVHKPEAVLAGELKALHQRLTEALMQVGIPVDHINGAADDDAGEEWKKTV